MKKAKGYFRQILTAVNQLWAYNFDAQKKIFHEIKNRFYKEGYVTLGPAVVPLLSVFL